MADRRSSSESEDSRTSVLPISTESQAMNPAETKLIDLLEETGLEQTPPTAPQAQDLSTPAAGQTSHRGIFTRFLDNMQSNITGTPERSEQRGDGAGNNKKPRPRPDKGALAREVKKLKKQLHQQDAEIQQLEAAHENMKKEKETLGEDLEECKEQIFRMQPIDVATDADIGTQYKTFCRTVETWAERQFGRAEGVLENIQQLLAPQWYMSAFLREYLGNGELAIIEDNPTAQVALARYLVHRHLFERILGQSDFHECLDVGSNELLDLILSGIRELTPKRGRQPRAPKIMALTDADDR